MEEVRFMVPQRRLDLEFNEPIVFKNYEISNADKKILRELAVKKAEIASLPVQTEKIAMWKKLNSLKPVRPLVWICDIPWHELNVNDELTNRTTTDFSRFLETRMRRTIYQWKHMRADMVVEPTLPCYLIICDSGFGITVNKKTRKIDEKSDTISQDYIPQIKNEDDIEKIKFPKVTYDEKSTEEMYQSMMDTFDGILKIEKKGIPGLDFGIWDQLISWYGVQEGLTDLVLRPDFIHKIMRRLTDAYIAQIDQYENKNLLSLNNGNYRIGSSGLSFTEELPQKDFNSGHIRTIDLWGSGTSQIFSAVSPKMHDEFALQYEIQYLSKFGLNNYGCCEPLHKKIDIISKIPRLRKISMSPWVDLDEGAEKIGKDFVFSWKPNSAILAINNWDPDFVRRDFAKSLNKIKKCSVEIIMKDLSTVRYEPHRLWEWAKIALEEAQKAEY
jgi:hypothetical protein